MMKLLCLSFAAVAVASQEVSETVKKIEESFTLDLDFLPTEALSNFGSFSEHLKVDISAALETVKHEDIISASTSFRGLQQQSEGDDDKCEKCVDGAEKWILDFAVKAFEKMCSSKPKCPFLKKMCEVNQKHPKVIKGFLFGKVGAHIDAFSYCVGKKECEMPKPPSLDCSSLTVEPKDEEDDMSLALRYMDNFLTSGEVMDDDDAAFNQAPQDLDNFESPRDCDCGDNRVPAHFFHDKSPTEKPPPPPKCDCICKGCVHHMTKFVLGMTIEKVKHICEHTKCPKVKKMCDWAKSHQEEAVGFLFAKVAPWKGAIGWCYGAGRCMPGPHHPHHHHKSTTKAPKEDEDESVIA